MVAVRGQSLGRTQVLRVDPPFSGGKEGKGKGKGKGRLWVGSGIGSLVIQGD